MIRRAVLVCEGPDDAQLVPLFVDRIAVETVRWVREDYGDAATGWLDELEQLRDWHSFEVNRSCLYWREVKEWSRRQKRYRFGRQFGTVADETAGRNALAMLRDLRLRPGLVVLSRDTDGNRERTGDRRKGLENAAGAAVSFGCAIVLAVAHTRIECWALAAFDPDSTDLSPLTHDQLGFNPIRESHELTASGDRDKRSAKRVLRALVGPDLSPVLDAVRRVDGAGTTFEQLKANGEHNGLRQFIEDLQPVLERALGQKPSDS